jgi:hypothetical protein
MQIAIASAGVSAVSAGWRSATTRWVKIGAFDAVPVSGSKSSSAYTIAAYGSERNFPCAGACRAQVSLPASSWRPVRRHDMRFSGPCTAV